MIFLPSENITFKTKLSEDELIRRLAGNIESKKAFRTGFIISDSSKSYEGLIFDHKFDIRRIIGYRNSFLPRIIGTIERDIDGTIIKVKMRLHFFVFTFLCVWCGGLGLAFLMLAFDRSGFNPAGIFPLFMLMIGYSFIMVCFKFESNLSKSDLKKLFEANIIDE